MGYSNIPVFDMVNARLNLTTSLKTVLISIQQVQQIQNQLQSIAYQTKNLKQLSGSDWDDTQQALNQLSAAIAQGRSLAYSASNIDHQFKTIYPGYQNQSSGTDYASDYKKWVQTNQDTMKGVMDQLSASYHQQAQEQAMSQRLAQKAQHTEGRMQALQVGNEIAAEQIAQMQKLKATMMAQANAQAEYYAYQAQKDAAMQQSVDAVIKTSDSVYPKYQEKTEFGEVPELGKGS